MDAEQELGELVRSRAFDTVASRALELYGPELYGFLINHFGGEADASEVFSQVAEDFWRGLPSFGARCSVRTWLYVLARNAATRFRRSPWVRQRTGDERLDTLVDQVRTRTRSWLRSDFKDRWRTLRESLAPDDRSLLVLRIDRQLSWQDCARVTLESDAADEQDLAREAGRLRKRFQLLKVELRDRARARGLLAEDS